jgi:hypothetical protein
MVRPPELPRDIKIESQGVLSLERGNENVRVRHECEPPEPVESSSLLFLSIFL